MGIHQIQIRHDPVEDRLLLRLTTTDHCEVRFWLTRRYTKRLWQLLVQMLESDRAVRQQVDPTVKRTVLDLQHEGYSRQADYTRDIEEAPRKLLLGETPVLLGKAQGKTRDDGAHLLSLQPLQGQGIDMTLDTRLLHIFSRLLREQVAKTDWDLPLALFDKGAEAQPAAEARKLN